MTTLRDLEEAPSATLEALFASAPVGPTPTGRFEGHALARVDRPHASGRIGDLLTAPFERLRWGVDFTDHTWFFVLPALKMGRHRLCPGRSRWRDTDVLALHYDVSRLPRPIRSRLYDEIKPLSTTLCLGIGGINRPAGAGDLFFFALHAAR